MRTLMLVLLVASFLPAGLRASDEPDPVAYHADVMTDPSLEKEKGESFCWHAAYSAGDFLEAYQAYKNTKWLDEAVLYFDYCIAKLGKDPDGYEGWIGPTEDSTPTIHEDALVGDAVLCAHLVEFAEVVLRDPALKERFGKKAQSYVDLTTRILWEKWNKRGCYYQDQDGWGSYHTYGKAIDTQTGKWIERPDTVLTQPLNKSFDAAIVLLRLWRITGKPEYRERVERIFGRGKMLFQHYPTEDRVVWNYWMPHGAWDIEGRTPKHWVGVHPTRPGYQEGEVSAIVEVYDSGLVFEQADLERMIRTNLWMSKGDGKHPWRSADGSSEAGALWSGLIRFDATLRAKFEESLGAKTDARTQIARAYFKNVTSQHLKWDRLYVKDPAQIKVAHPPLQAGQALALALPIPDLIETAAGSRLRLATKTLAAGNLKIELLDATGKTVLGTLATVDVPKDAEYNAPRWDGTNPKTGKKDLGEYRIRWTLNGESRVEPVWVKLGTKRENAGPAVLSPGDSISVDFETDALDKRWHVEGATVSAEQAHGGKKSLKLAGGQTAVLNFGGDDDLPVKVSFWIYDNGKTFGNKTLTGPGWGVKTADGDILAVRTCWRSYLDGDANFAWFNTGENNWYDPHPANLGRTKGWSEWVFDFSDRANPKMTGGGRPLGNLVAKFVPHGTVALFLMGGDGDAGPLYVDDIRVELHK